MVLLNGFDWSIIVAFFVIALAIGVLVAKRAGSSSAEFFLSGRHMPWWLLGFSMVATTFSTDTPNLVTDIVRQNGVAGNWVWWAFLLTGMLTVFIYARLWRRSKVLTDVEFYEIRYSGKAAAFLRGFRALYLGILFNIVVMGGVSLAAIKIGGAVLGYSPLQTILVASIVTVIFSALGGLRSVLLTDFLLFIVAMIGAVAAAVVAVNLVDVGSLQALFAHDNVKDKLDLIPAFVPGDTDKMDLFIGLLVVPLAVQWWSVWYPGSEPGGGGYLAQRMLAAKDEKHATGATLFFNAAHYALRPWPWIIVALCSLIVFPMDSRQQRDSAAAALKEPETKALIAKIGDAPATVDRQTRDRIQALKFRAEGLTSLRKAFPSQTTPDDKVGHDLAYPAMLTFLPHGLLGLVLASLIAAYMSTISTHLNWGSSYVVNDFYKRFVNPRAGEKQLVLVGRISTVLMMVLAAFFALKLEHAKQLFDILLLMGAGTGLIFILRWFWWRINAFSELTAMVVSFVIAVYFKLFHADFFPEFELKTWQELVINIGVTTICWVAVMLLSRPTDGKTLRRFCEMINPGGMGWRRVYRAAEDAGEPIVSVHEPVNIPRGIICMVVGCLAVYSALFATGYYLYGQIATAVVLTAVAMVSAVFLAITWKRGTVR